MPPALRILIFLAAVAAIFISAGVVVCYWLVAKLRRQPATLPRRSKLVVAAAALGIGCIAYGFWVEPYWPSVTHVEIKTAKFAPGSQRVRIVQISDVHSDPVPRLEEKLPAIIAEQKPDLIFLPATRSIVRRRPKAFAS